MQKLLRCKQHPAAASGFSANSWHKAQLVKSSEISESRSAGAGVDGIAARADWWEHVTLISSLLWWVDWWLRRTQADAAGRVDPSAEREAGYRLDHVARRLAQLEQLIDA